MFDLGSKSIRLNDLGTLKIIADPQHEFNRSIQLNIHVATIDGPINNAEFTVGHLEKSDDRQPTIQSPISALVTPCGFQSSTGVHVKI